MLIAKLNFWASTRCMSERRTSSFVSSPSSTESSSSTISTSSDSVSVSPNSASSDTSICSSATPKTSSASSICGSPSGKSSNSSTCCFKEVTIIAWSKLSTLITPPDRVAKTVFNSRLTSRYMQKICLAAIKKYQAENCTSSLNRFLRFALFSASS